MYTYKYPKFKFQTYKLRFRGKGLLFIFQNRRFLARKMHVKFVSANLSLWKSINQLDMWCILAVLAFRRQRQEGREFKTSLVCIVSGHSGLGKILSHRAYKSLHWSFIGI